MQGIRSKSSKCGQISGQEHTEGFMDALTTTTVFLVGTLVYPFTVSSVLAIIRPE
jgi:hypothetical protein